MTVLRNLLTVVGVLAIIGVALFLVRGDIGDRLGITGWAKPTPTRPEAPTGKVYVTLSASQGTLIRDTTGPDTNALDIKDLSELAEAQNTGFPPRNIPYLAVVNTSKKEVRYWKLSKNVRKVSLRSSPLFNVDVKQPASPPGAPYQVEIWVPREGDLNLEFELGPPGSSVS